MNDAEIRAEWKGPWMCEGCRVIFARHPGNWHYVGRRFDGEPCLGPAVRYDRRARPSEKQELAEALKALTYSAGETYAVAEWLNREAQCVKIGYDPLFEVPGNVVPLANSIDYKRAKEDWDSARALLRRYEVGEG